MRWEFLKFISKLIAFADENGYTLICFYFHRTQEEQDKLRAEGKSNVKRSNHQRWLAEDLAILEGRKALFGRDEATKEKYKILGEYWKSLHPALRWGGDWKRPYDPYHFELSPYLWKRANK